MKPEATPRALQKGPDYIRVMCVFATNQCNLACIQCCAPTVKNAKRAQSLSWEDLKAAIDTFMDPELVPYAGRKLISIQGGEPFLVYPVLRAAAEYRRSFPLVPELSVHTNGTVAKVEQLRELQALGVEILFSLDGNRDGNDRFRRFPPAIKRSVWDSALTKIGALESRAGIGVNMTLRPEALGGVLEALDRFTALGVRVINLEPDCYRLWTGADLAALREFFAALADYYERRTLAEGRCPFHWGTLHDGLERAAYLKQGKAWWRECTQLILGSDGHFYNCEASHFFDYDTPAPFNWSAATREHGIHRAADRNGVDWEKRGAYMDEADRALGELGPDLHWQIVCPRLYYSMERNNRLAGAQGKDLRAMAANTLELSKVYQDGMMRLAARLREHADFRAAYIERRSVQGF